MLMEGLASRFTQRASGLWTMGLTGLGSLRVAQTEPEGDEMSRAGMRFHMSAMGATGIAPVQALPSTAAQWLIWNPNGNQVTAFIDVLGMGLPSGTAGAGGTTLACVVGPKFAPATVPTASAGNVTINNANPVSSRTSNLIVVSAQTLVNAVVGNWFPVAWMNPAQTVLGQTQMINTDVRGKLMIPPGCGLALCNVSPTGTSPLFAPVASWREYASDNE